MGSLMCVQISLIFHIRKEWGLMCVRTLLVVFGLSRSTLYSLDESQVVWKQDCVVSL